MTKHNPLLCDHIAERIAKHPKRRITFAEYMDLVLYDPQAGYYVTQANRMGWRGDFVTAVHLGPDLGELLAEQFVQLWSILGYPQPFTLVEMGAGQGLLARDLLNYLRSQHYSCWEATQYWIVERSAALVALQQHHLQGFPVRWMTWEEVPSAAVTGCFFSNELIDAFPVHQFVIHNQKLHEVYVTVQPENQNGWEFCELIAEPSTPQLLDYFELLGIDIESYPEGYRSEVNLAALDWLKTVSERLRQGYLFTIDYGYPAHRYYSTARRAGTLQCYYQHAHHSDPYLYIGYQDLTTHVNFTALQRQGERYGLEVLGFVEQGLFLMALGLGDRLAALSQEERALSPREIQERLQRRQTFHTLMDPLGMGNFGVLIQAKGLTPQQQHCKLKGLELPTRLP